MIGGHGVVSAVPVVNNRDGKVGRAVGGIAGEAVVKPLRAKQQMHERVQHER